MNKTKVRCSVCGKTFKTPSSKKTICPSCEAASKRARHQGAPATAAPAPVTPAATVDVRAALRAAQVNQGQFGAYRQPDAPPAPVAHAPAGEPARAGAGETGTSAARTPSRSSGRPRPPRPAPKPRAERPKRQPERTPPFAPSAEQIAAIRERYLALAQPEFDGIRHRIANELGIPLKAVKDVVKQVRVETATPSWWERVGAQLEPDQLERVRELYLPLLPEPVIGVHKQLASTLKFSHTSVYQAIATIRAELNLPRYQPRDDAPEAAAPGMEEAQAVPAAAVEA